ncbi:hypothetical protein [Rhodanobacter lindaniclasticus]
MKAMTPDKARREYPDAWGNIQQQIADVRRDSDADVIALSVSIIDVAGVPTLELLTLTDLGAADDDTPASGLRFRAPIATAPATRTLQ